MKKSSSSISMGILLIGLSFNGFPENDLSIRQNIQHPQMAPGYIDEATLVVEPYGAFSEQSLYIKYSDHGRFSGQNVLVLHSFELPQNAVVNDLWLWMGDSVMQAKIFERKYAQYLWDSITHFNRDPAFLKQTGNQFELDVFPLTGGSYRKIKMKCQISTRFVGTTPYIDLPIKFLKADNSSGTPLRILFRSMDDKWGIPKIVEAPALSVDKTIDTLGKRYRVIAVNDVKQFATLTLTYNPKLNVGYCTQIFKSDSATYYSLGIHEAEFFKTPFSASRPNKKLIALDFSGFYNVDSTMLFSQIPVFLRSYLSIKDSFKIVLAGQGLFDTFPQTGWAELNDFTIQNPLASLVSGKVIRAKATVKKPRVLFLGPSADMRFPGIEKYADLDSVLQGDYASAISKVASCDIAANYFMWEAGPDNYNSAVDAFLQRGGIFIGFFCFNRTKSNIAHRYISGLPTANYGETFDKGLKFRAKNGNLGYGFPDKIDCDVSEKIQSSDPGIVNELIDEAGAPVVVSKRIGKGLFVLRSIWHMHETPGIWRALCSPLYNFQNQGTASQLGDLLRMINSLRNQLPFGEALLLSNSDSLVTPAILNNFASPGMLDSLTGTVRVNAISLLSTGNPSVTVKNTIYYGSGYVLDTVAKKSGGFFLTLSNQSWNQMAETIGKDAMPLHDQFHFFVSANGVIDSSAFISSTNPTNIRFFTGRTQASNALEFTLNSKYKTLDSLFSRKVSISIDSSSTTDSSIVFWYGQYELKEMLGAPTLDTQKVVAFATKNRLLCDFSAFIALEPNSENHFLIDPKDESVIGGTYLRNIQKAGKIPEVLLLFIPGIHPSFIIRSPFDASVELGIFNLSGKRLASVTQSVQAGKNSSFLCNKIKLAIGMYVAVAKIHPQGIAGNKDIQTIINRFSIK